MEAVSNSIHAITERFDADAGKRGRIDVTVVRNPEDDQEPIIGFDVEDNGVGFTTDNYTSFLTPDSRGSKRSAAARASAGSPG
jgi:nitrogen fixation/metabolism regulation signal transduction histidine kinase